MKKILFLPTIFLHSGKPVQNVVMYFFAFAIGTFKGIKFTIYTSDDNTIPSHIILLAAHLEYPHVIQEFMKNWKMEKEHGLAPHPLWPRITLAIIISRE